MLLFDSQTIAQVCTDNMDHFLAQPWLSQLQTAFAQSTQAPLIAQAASRSWYGDYLQFVRNSAAFNGSLDPNNRPPNPQAFVQWLDVFLRSANGVQYAQDIIFQPSPREVLVTKMDYRFTPTSDFAALQTRVSDVRAVLNAAVLAAATQLSGPGASGFAFNVLAYGDSFFAADEVGNLEWEMHRGVLTSGLLSFLGQPTIEACLSMCWLLLQCWRCC